MFDFQVILDIVVKPDKPVISYLTALTGLTQDIIDSKGVSLPDAVQQLRGCLPRDAVLVGQNILQDVQWLGLKEGTDFKSCLDLAGGQGSVLLAASCFWHACV
jgi:RNA exonuclease 4